MLLPPMPWTVYRNMTDEDLKAVYAYLTTLKPVRNFVRASPTAVSTRSDGRGGKPTHGPSQQSEFVPTSEVPNAGPG